MSIETDFEEVQRAIEDVVFEVNAKDQGNNHFGNFAGMVKDRNPPTIMTQEKLEILWPELGAVVKKLASYI